MQARIMLSASKAPPHLVLARNEPAQIQTGDGAILDRPVPGDHNAIRAMSRALNKGCEPIAIAGEAQFVELE